MISMAVFFLSSVESPQNPNPLENWAGLGHKGADMSLIVRAQVTQVEIHLEKWPGSYYLR